MTNSRISKDNLLFVFSYSPLEYVTITAYDFHARGRIQRCIITDAMRPYYEQVLPLQPNPLVACGRF